MKRLKNILLIACVLLGKFEFAVAQAKDLKPVFPVKAENLITIDDQNRNPHNLAQVISVEAIDQNKVINAENPELRNLDKLPVNPNTKNEKIKIPEPNLQAVKDKK